MDLRDKIKSLQGTSNCAFLIDETTGARHVWVAEFVLTSPVKDVTYSPENKADVVTTMSGSRYIVPNCLTHYRMASSRIDAMRQELVTKRNEIVAESQQSNDWLHFSL